MDNFSESDLVIIRDLLGIGFTKGYHMKMEQIVFEAPQALREKTTKKIGWVKRRARGMMAYQWAESVSRRDAVAFAMDDWKFWNHLQVEGTNDYL